MASAAGASLGRSCEPTGDGAADGITAAPAFPGIERIEARFHGDAFSPHRHDTYGLGVTLHGVQTFHYRGQRRYSQPGNVIILHPDEEHDGGAGTDEALRYRMLYLEPALLRRCLDADGQPGAALPFVGQPVLADAELRQVLLPALSSLDEGLEDLAVDDLLVRLARCLARHAGAKAKPLGLLAQRQAHRARDYLEANALAPVRSEDLEAVTGLDRYALARHFRALFATSPHRFLVMRRLQHARRMITDGEPLAEVAAAAGFADQSHLNRHFRKAYGMTPGRWATLVRPGGTRPGGAGARRLRAQPTDSIGASGPRSSVSLSFNRRT
ncbi:AraC family transcriptional regulator [Nitrospirillum amazonense]|uniref:AraC family transcriptional regulator n=1 Tax=Nitrospirillum amazonense TaxID=28077 RepID=UPI002412BED3|nr:AraC family transcriptional regulator [Nitrospirillum amazonense]MDG3441737.1 AraC family transcriptional regulator [Nitrospirillum amazonense]